MKCAFYGGNGVKMERFNAMGKEFSINDEVMCRDDEDGVFVQYEDAMAEITRLIAERDSQQRISLNYLELIRQMEEFMDVHSELFVEGSHDWYLVLMADAKRFLRVKPDKKNDCEEL